MRPAQRLAVVPLSAQVGATQSWAPRAPAPRRPRRGQSACSLWRLISAAPRRDEAREGSKAASQLQWARDRARCRKPGQAAPAATWLRLRCSVCWSSSSVTARKQPLRVVLTASGGTGPGPRGGMCGHLPGRHTGGTAEIAGGGDARAFERRATGGRWAWRTVAWRGGGSTPEESVQSSWAEARCNHALVPVWARGCKAERGAGVYPSSERAPL